jgi:hypothetical protein
VNYTVNQQGGREFLNIKPGDLGKAKKQQSGT